MTDFDANEDPTRMSGGGKDEPLEPAAIRPRVVRRARHLAYGQCSARQGRPERRVGALLLVRRRRATRCACPDGRHVPMLGAPPRQRRRLWTQCHGRASGPPR